MSEEYKDIRWMGFSAKEVTENGQETFRSERRIDVNGIRQVTRDPISGAAYLVEFYPLGNIRSTTMTMATAHMTDARKGSLEGFYRLKEFNLKESYFGQLLLRINNDLDESVFEIAGYVKKYVFFGKVRYRLRNIIKPEEPDIYRTPEQLKAFLAMVPIVRKDVLGKYAS